jgi:hypothetical protein
MDCCTIQTLIKTCDNFYNFPPEYDNSESDQGVVHNSKKAHPIKEEAKVVKVFGAKTDFRKYIDQQ